MKMHSRVRSVLLPMACLTALGAFVSAQAGDKPAPKAETKSSIAKPKEASAHEMGTYLKLDVAGLTKENSDKIRTALMAAEVTDHACEHCNVHMAMAGKCPVCSGELKSEKELMFGKVQPAAESKTLALTLSPEHPTRLSDIQAALRAQSITLVPEKLAVAGRAELWLSGGTSDSVAPLKKALEEAKLFKSVEITWDAATKELRVATVAGTTPATQEQVNTVLHELKLKLDDIVWGPIMTSS